MTNNLQIVFFGTPEFSAIILEKMIEVGYAPMAVVTAPDKPVGRKQVLTPPPVKLLAEKNKIQVLQPNKISDFRLQITDLRPDLIVLAAFGQIIPKEILEIPKYGCLNVHPSLLPKYRGASPIQAAILNGDTETGITIMLMDEFLDHGPIVAQQQLEISNSKTQMTNKFQNPNDKITTVELTKILAELGAELLIETIPKWIKGEIKAVAQDESKATFTKIIKKEDGRISWHKSAEKIERVVRAYNPWPSAYTYLKCQNPNNKCQINDKMLKILKAEVLETENKKEPGMVFLVHSASSSTLSSLPKGSVLTPSKVEGLTEKKELAVACGKDALILEEIQLEGKKIITAKEFLNGYPEIIGAKLE